jgi:hypothetical protein
MVNAGLTKAICAFGGGEIALAEICTAAAKGAKLTCSTLADRLLDANHAVLPPIMQY